MDDGGIGSTDDGMSVERGETGRTAPVEYSSTDRLRSALAAYNRSLLAFIAASCVLNAVRVLVEAVVLDVVWLKGLNEELKSRRDGDWTAFLQHAGHAWLSDRRPHIVDRTHRAQRWHGLTYGLHGVAGGWHSR
jgi:hypothetical protein